MPEGGYWEWPVYWAEITAYRGGAVRASGSAMMNMGGDTGVSGRICASASDRHVVMTHPYGENRSGRLYFYRLPATAGSLDRLAQVITKPPPASLPQSLAGVKASRGRPDDEWFGFRTEPRMGFIWPDLCWDPVGLSFSFCALDYYSHSIQVAHSPDAQKWGAATAVAPNACFPSIAARGGRVAVLYTAGTYQNQWPDDGPQAAWSEETYWPVTGVLKYRLSTDGGKSWGEPRNILDGKDVISSRCTFGPDGSLWVGCIRLVAGDAGTSVWLIHSPDGGKTWDKPERVTDGKMVDRDVDITVLGKKLMIAFTRSLWRKTPTSIWLWQRDLPAAGTQTPQ